MRGNRLAFFVTLGIVIIVGALASSAAACVSAGHGGLTNCDLPTGWDTSQHCFAGKIRNTPKTGSAYTLDVTAYITPTVFPGLMTPCTGRAYSSWVMSSGGSPQADGTPNLIQVGYWMDCNWNGSLYYFQTVHDGNDTACSPQPYCRWRNTLLWPWTSGAGQHLFTVRRTAGTNNFQSYIDGYAYFPPVTVPTSYAQQQILTENTVPNSKTAACNATRFHVAGYPTGPPGQYQFPWYESTTTIADPGMHLSENPPWDSGSLDWWDGSDWAS